MRAQIINAVFHRMARDPAVYFVTADMGINLVEKIADAYPNRFVNVGIAEQNMIGVCAGLVNGGYRPVAYTISNFAVQRCFEQIRNDVGIHEYPIVILGTSTGYDNSPLGPTHHIVDDWGAARAVHNLEIHCPGSVPYAEFILDDLLDRSVPAYLRIPKGEFAWPPCKEPWFYHPGQSSQTLLISYGGPVQACIQAQKANPAFSLLIVNRVRPLDQGGLMPILAKHERLVVVEDHFAETGLYSSICQLLATNKIMADLYSRGPQKYYLEVGSGQEYFWKRYRGDAEALVKDFS